MMMLRNVPAFASFHESIIRSWEIIAPAITNSAQYGAFSKYITAAEIKNSMVISHRKPAGFEMLSDKIFCRPKLKALLNPIT
jgi:hypothetical protein